MKKYSTKTNAIRAARSELDEKTAQAGRDFVLHQHVSAKGESTWSWTQMDGWVKDKASAKKPVAPESPAEPIVEAVDEPEVELVLSRKSGKIARPVIARRPIKASGDPAANGPSKKVILIARLKEKGGASAADLQREFGWLPHTLRGAISTLSKQLGRTIESYKSEAGVRYYRLAAD